MDHSLTAEQIDRVIEMAWEDRTPFEAISFQFGISEMETKIIMRKKLKRSSYELWRKRVTNRKTKHEKLRSFSEGRFKCKLQRQITNNKISKR
ncbi:TIGR03643 family protein [Flavobacterium sp. HNIBRBA15423]|uniref:TIGR03643 family protein n=1 Tax=Flavobacterium sp. HNIBRBA15423 TaxID=3458683 RepID=UPI004043CDD1